MYYIPDSILYISDSQTQQYWTDANALKIVNEFVSQMNDRGFERTNDKAAADLGIQVSYTKDVTLIVDNPYWWYDYPYWDPTWWGPWSGWYPYPYPVVYSYSMGSLMAEIIDLDAPVSGNLPVTWSAYMSGLLSGSASIDMELTLDAVDQAFDQSPYIVYGE